MRIAKTIAQARQAVSEARQLGRSIGLVPTMGALHDGHWSLVQKAVSQCDTVVVSIFVNAAQFGPGEDFDRYPRALGADIDGCERHGVAVAFCPDDGEVYPEPLLTRVVVGRMTERLCGRFRPGHFDAVCSVVCKLFNIIRPDRAYFGEKDYQQLVVIRRMVRDLDMPVEIVGCPTVRQADGLAISSRNALLSPEMRRCATAIHEALAGGVSCVAQGESGARAIIAAVESRIKEAGAESVDYVSVVDADTLDDVEIIDGPARICVAAHFGGARLIDNVAVDKVAVDGSRRGG